MLNTSKVISKLIVLVLSVVATTTTARAIERSQPSCDVIKNAVTTTQSKNRISSKLCSPRRKLFTLSYNYNLRDISIYSDGKRTVLEKIKKDFDPKLVSRPCKIRFFKIQNTAAVTREQRRPVN
jgi:hypothetical protein